MRQIPKFTESPPITALLGPKERAAIMERFVPCNTRMGEAYGVRLASEVEEQAETASLQPLEPALVSLLVAQLREQDRQLAANEWLYSRTPEAIRA